MIGALLFAFALQLGPAPPPQPTCTIRGRVTNAEGRPLSGATVQLQRAGGSYDPRPVRADATGGFEITNVAAGDYMLFVSRPGYQRTRYPERVGKDPWTNITLAPGEVKTRINVVLHRLGAIEGRIVDRNGEPVEGVIVSALAIPPHSLRGQRAAMVSAAPRRTNELGQFRVYGLNQGDYYVTASGVTTNGLARVVLPGHGTTFFPGTLSAANAQVVHVGPSETVEGIDFALARARLATISGQMVSSDGQPFGGGIQLHLSRHSMGVDLGSVGAIIGANGRFEFRNVSPGSYVIEAANNNERAFQPVTVDGADVDGIIVQTQRGSTVDGRIVFEGGSAASVRSVGEISAVTLDPDLAGAQARAPVRPDLSFQLTNVFGPRLLHFIGAVPGWTVKQIYAGGNDVTDAFVSFGAGQLVNDVEVVLTDQLTKITGTVVDRRGNPMAGGIVVAFSDDPARWTPLTRFLSQSTSGPDGTFTIGGLPPGSYFVGAVDTFPGGGLADALRDPEFLEPLSRSAKRVTVTERQPVSVTLRVVEQ